MWIYQLFYSWKVLVFLNNKSPSLVTYFIIQKPEEESELSDIEMHPDDSNIVDVIEKNAPGTSNRQLREIALKWNSIRKKSEEV